MSDLPETHRIYLQDLDLPGIRRVVFSRLGEQDGLALWKAMGGSKALESAWQVASQEKVTEAFWEPTADMPFGWWSDERKAWAAIHKGTRLIPLCRRPYNLHMVLKVWKENYKEPIETRLPASRGKLYDKFVKTLLVREEKNDEKRGQPWGAEVQPSVFQLLTRIAAELQQRKMIWISRSDALETSTTAHIERWLNIALAADILETVTLADESQIKFSHHLLQEFFAARKLLESFEAWEKGQPIGGTPLFDPWWEPGVWRETVVILGEWLNDGVRGPNRVARWLASSSPEVALNVILEHSEQFQIEDIETKTRDALIASAREKGDLSKAHATDPRGRAAAWRVLGRLNADPRPGIGVDANGIPLFDWVPIPAGDFLMGDKKQPAKVEKPYRISRYPVTYTQYKAFLDAKGGYEDKSWWKDLHPDALKQMEGDQQTWKIGNHPAEGVSWYDAMAFCAWLTEKLGYEVRLPTEEEWEKAARGTDGRIYPYGNEFDAAKGNVSNTGIGQTSAIGIFPNGASPYGVLDMSGNVLEWMLTIYIIQKSINITNSTVGAWRGSSWGDNEDSARAVGYKLTGSDYRSNNGGFRVVAAPIS